MTLLFPEDRQSVAHNGLRFSDGKAPKWDKWTPAIISEGTYNKNPPYFGTWEPRSYGSALQNLGLDDVLGDQYIYELGYKKPNEDQIVAVYLGETERGARLRDYLRNGSHHADDIDTKLRSGRIIYARKALTDTPFEDEEDLLEGYCWEWNKMKQKHCKRKY